MQEASHGDFRFESADRHRGLIYRVEKFEEKHVDGIF
jgi:hypothetical protein